MGVFVELPSRLTGHKRRGGEAGGKEPPELPKPRPSLSLGLCFFANPSSTVLWAGVQDI